MEQNQRSSSRLNRKPLSDSTNTLHNLQTLTKPPKLRSKNNVNTNINSNNNDNNSKSMNLKRKPLSDCTNTRKNRHSSKLISKTISKIPKIPSNFNTDKKNENPNFNSSSNVVKSHASIGSNDFDGVPPQPPTPFSCSGDIVLRRPGPSAALTQTHDEQTRNEKGKSVEATPIVQACTDSASRSEHIPPLAVSGSGGHPNRSPTVENFEVDEQRRKDKGKMVVETPIIDISPSLTSHALETSSSAASGNYIFLRPSAVLSHKTDIQANRDNIRTVQETSNFEEYGNIIYRSSVPSSTLTIRENVQTANDKGKSVAATPIIENLEVDEQRRKDKGKMVVETPIIHISSPLASHTLQTSSSAASVNYELPRPSAAHYHKQDTLITQVKKDNIRIVQTKPNVEPFGPVTPCPPISSFASGTDGQEKTGLIVFNQRRTSLRRKLAGGSISLPFSCPPTKRTKKKGVKLDYGGGDGHSGAHSDPFPLHKKKRARNKKEDSMHAMPQDEVEKLKAYYADIDAFHLSEEEASDTE